jgi:hypothetical protein
MIKQDQCNYYVKKLRGFAPLANYADRATAAFWRSSGNFCGYRVLRGQRNGSPRPLVSVFLTGAATISSKQLLICPHEAEWIPFQTHCFSENLEAPGICGQKLRPIDHKLIKIAFNFIPLFTSAEQSPSCLHCHSNVRLALMYQCGLCAATS